MDGPTQLVYSFIIFLIRLYKWVEFQILKLFSTSIIKNAVKFARSINVILEHPDGTEYYQQDGDKDKPQLLKNCDSVVRIKVNREEFFTRVANLGLLGFGETFMDGSWDCHKENFEDITEFLTRLCENDLHCHYYKFWHNALCEHLELHAFNLQTVERSYQVGKVHYDLGNDLYELMLDPWMQYTCGYWKDADNLNEAQVAKMELIAKKLDLKPGMRVLDIGCGWGTLCKYLAKNYKVKCVGITISEKGVEYANDACAGLPVEVRLQDYREIDEKFDRIVSVGMFEHVGFRNYRTFFEVARRCLEDDGIFLLHTIARNHTTIPRSEPWLNTYIFPNGNVPNPEDLAKSTRDLFVIEDLHNFGADYAKTLFCWRENFVKNWHKIEGKYGGERFFRMWIYFLSFSRALFRANRLQLWQVVLSKDGMKREYRAAR